MIRLSRLAVLVAALMCGTARVSWSQSVPPDTGTVSFDVDHVHVILRRNPANDVVAANIYLLGGTRQATPATAGIEALMLSASDGGTRKYPRRALRTITGNLGASIVIQPSVDWTTFGLRTLRQAFDSSWAAFADRLVEPRLDSTDVERARLQMLTGALQAEADPDAAVARLAEGLLYADHPYRLAPEGTAASLRTITWAEVRSYHDSTVVQSRLLVIVVGNVDRAQLERAIRRTLATLPMGTYSWTLPPDFTPSAQRLAVSTRSLATNYILGYYAGPRAGTHDYTVLRIATAVLTGRVFAEVRSRQHLAYAVEAPFLEQAISVGGLYVTTTDPAAALSALFVEVRRLQTSLVDSAGLRTLVGQFITDYFLKNETDADQASFLARAELYDGDYRKAGAFVSELRGVVPEDVRRVAQAYMHGTRFGFVGDTAAAPAALFDRF